MPISYQRVKGFMKTIPLSVLDQSPVRSGGTAFQAIQETIELAQTVEKLGYRRFWVSEHHASEGLAGCSPEVLLARLGAETDSIRIGSGGVMLPHYSPYKVAENFKLLQTMYPGRMDVGVGRAPGSDQYTAAALRYGSGLGPEYFPNKVADLEALLRNQPPRTQGMEHAVATPFVDEAPELWMLGSSPDSANLAGLMGLPYSYAYFINANMPDDLFDRYRLQFEKSEAFASGGLPLASLGVFVICADTEEEAIRLSKSRDLWYIKFATEPKGPQIPTVEEAETFAYTREQAAFVRSNRQQMIVGTPEQVSQRLHSMVDRYQLDELVVVTITHNFAARCRSYQLLAEAWF